MLGKLFGELFLQSCCKRMRMTVDVVRDNPLGFAAMNSGVL